MVFTISQLKEKYSTYANPLDKVKRESYAKNLFRLTRGLYETDRNVNPIFLAAPILSPSYISFEYALSYYGFIPERVVAITSASLQVRKNKTFNNDFGRFEYSDIPPSAFSSGLVFIESNGHIAKIASKEKAICDSLYKWRKTKNIKELKELIFEDKRIDEDEFNFLDFNELIRIAELYKDINLKLLIKLIRKEYL